MPGCLAVISILVSTLGSPAPTRDGRLPTLKVSENRRFLVTSEGKPFFYLADTAWELFHRLDRVDAQRYLRRRAEQGFTVVQAVVLAEMDGLTEPNPYGQVPLRDNDPTRPNEAYFEHVDWVVHQANDLGLYVAVLPTWGDKVNKKWGKGPEIFTPANARTYGEFLGRRYRQAGIIWILGGDRPIEKLGHLEVWKAMATGLRAGDEGCHLISYHPMGGGRSRQHFAGADDILDFHAQQNGHNVDTPVWERIARDYAVTPAKPVLDMEPLYEGHPIDFKPKEKGHSNAADIRKFAYWDVFSGACGHTYGHHSVWQFYSPKRTPINLPLVTWDVALEDPGANQMRHLRALVESRPFLTRIPAPEMLPDPGAGGKRIVATRDEARTYALIYCPASRPFRVNLDGWPTALTVTLFNPRSGETKGYGTLTPASPVLTPPNVGENQDWVFILTVQ